MMIAASTSWARPNVVPHIRTATPCERRYPAHAFARANPACWEREQVHDRYCLPDDRGTTADHTADQRCHVPHRGARDEYRRPREKCLLAAWLA